MVLHVQLYNYISNFTYKYLTASIFNVANVFSDSFTLI